MQSNLVLCKEQRPWVVRSLQNTLLTESLSSDPTPSNHDVISLLPSLLRKVPKPSFPKQPIPKVQT